MKTFLAAAFVASLFAGSSVASALPLTPSTALSPSDVISDVIQVRDGCGRGFHRNIYGRCRPDRVIVRPFVRRCPPGFFLNRYGRCRPY